MIEDKKFKEFEIVIINNEDGFQLESAELGNNKKMLIVTDTHFRIDENTYVQKAYGPYNADDLCDNKDFSQVVSKLKNDLLNTRDSRKDYRDKK